MATLSLEELYARYVKPLPPAERLRLVAMTTQDLAEAASQEPRRKWREIRGAAPYPLSGEDAQEWVTRGRHEDDVRRERHR